MSGLPKSVRLIEVGPREGFQYEGIGDPQKISTEKKIRLIDLLGQTGLKTLQIVSFVSPKQVPQMADAEEICKRLQPMLTLILHLHDTRGLGIANVYAALLEGVAEFDTAVAGLGGCPFAGHTGAAGNVCTEEVVFLCRQLGIASGVDLEALVKASRFAQSIVGHALPSSLLHARLAPVPAEAA
jgi:hydroxymethylglutaryl-CoA lyase